MATKPAVAAAATKVAAAASGSSSSLSSGVIRCTRRIRDPLNYLIMQPTDHDQVTTSISTTDAAMVTFYVPLHNLQHCLHKRYEAEQFGELILPRGAALPIPKALTPTQEELRETAAAKSGPTVNPKFVMSADDLKAGGGPFGNNSNSINARTPEDPLFNSLNNYINEKGENVVPLGLVTLIAGNNTPAHQTRLERWIDPAPHPTISMRVMVMDRIHWQRTTWVAGSICKSLCWGRLPQRIFSINLDFANGVLINGSGGGGENNESNNSNVGGKDGKPALIFDEKQQKYVTPYTVEVPGLGFKLTMEDTGRTLFDPRTRITDGFLDNESALHRLALTREVNMLGLGGSVYRQTLWSSPALPNVGRVVDCQFGSLFERYFGCSPVGVDPVASWIVKDVPTTLIYQMEGEVEDENDPNSATTYGDRSLTERVQKKAMNRYNGFRDDIRGKAYSEQRGDEMPR